MKLSYEDKLEIYTLRKQGGSIRELSKQFQINESNIKYMICLMDRYDPEIVKKGKKKGLTGLKSAVKPINNFKELS